MEWVAAEGNGPLIAVRAIHFSATAIIAGTLVFRTLVAQPALLSDQPVADGLRTQSLRVAWTALAVTLLSGVGRLLLHAVSIIHLPPGEALTSQILTVVL